jgi:hypothetical protein
LKIRQILTAGLSLLLLVCGTVLVAEWIEQSLWYFPTPDKPSAFLRSYAPEKIVESFASQQYCRQTGYGTSSAAGRKYVTNTRSVEPMFAIRAEDRVALLVALKSDMSAQLIRNRAEILSERGDPDSGFRFTYRLGKNLGTATIPPLTAKHWTDHDRPLPTGIEDVDFNITISEKWFPQEAATIQASLQIR